MQGTVFIFTELLHCIIIISRSTTLGFKFFPAMLNNHLIEINNTSTIFPQWKGKDGV